MSRIINNSDSLNSEIFALARDEQLTDKSGLATRRMINYLEVCANMLNALNTETKAIKSRLDAAGI